MRLLRAALWTERAGRRAVLQQLPSPSTFECEACVVHSPRVGCARGGAVPAHREVFDGVRGSECGGCTTAARHVRMAAQACGSLRVPRGAEELVVVRHHFAAGVPTPLPPQADAAPQPSLRSAGPKLPGSGQPCVPPPPPLRHAPWARWSSRRYAAAAAATAGCPALAGALPCASLQENVRVGRSHGGLEEGQAHRRAPKPCQRLSEQVALQAPCRRVVCFFHPHQLIALASMNSSGARDKLPDAIVAHSLATTGRAGSLHRDSHHLQGDALRAEIGEQWELPARGQVMCLAKQWRGSGQPAGWRRMGWRPAMVGGVRVLVRHGDDVGRKNAPACCVCPLVSAVRSFAHTFAVESNRSGVQFGAARRRLQLAERRRRPPPHDCWRRRKREAACCPARLCCSCPLPHAIPTDEKARLQARQRTGGSAAPVLQLPRAPPPLRREKPTAAPRPAARRGLLRLSSRPPRHVHKAASSLVAHR